METALPYIAAIGLLAAVALVVSLRALHRPQKHAEPHWLPSKGHKRGMR